MSVDGLIVSGVAGGGVLGRARPVVVDIVILGVNIVVVVGVLGAAAVVVVAAAVVVDDLGDDLLTSEGDLDELLLVVGDNEAVAVAVASAAAAAEAVDALGVDALVLKKGRFRG